MRAARRDGNRRQSERHGSERRVARRTLSLQDVARSELAGGVAAPAPHFTRGQHGACVGRPRRHPHLRRTSRAGADRRPIGTFLQFAVALGRFAHFEATRRSAAYGTRGAAEAARIGADLRVGRTTLELEPGRLVVIAHLDGGRRPAAPRAGSARGWRNRRASVALGRTSVVPRRAETVRAGHAVGTGEALAANNGTVAPLRSIARGQYQAARQHRNREASNRLREDAAERAPLQRTRARSKHVSRLEPRSGFSMILKNSASGSG